MDDSGRVLIVTDVGELELIKPQCQSCIFYERQTFTCPAFPTGIASSISLNEYDHRKLYPLQNGALHWLPYPGHTHPMDGPGPRAANPRNRDSDRERSE